MKLDTNTLVQIHSGLYKRPVVLSVSMDQP